MNHYEQVVKLIEEINQKIPMFAHLDEVERIRLEAKQASAGVNLQDFLARLKQIEERIILECEQRRKQIQWPTFADTQTEQIRIKQLEVSLPA
jgi:hypothetical protein